jgi:hypothetical protein
MDSNKIRQFVAEQYVKPAQVRGDKTVTVTAGEVQKALGLKNRIAWVCTALRANRFQFENHLRLKEETGPPSGMSTTVKFTYEFVSDAAQGQTSKNVRNPVWDLFGIAKQTFAELGGGENFIRSEREQFFPAIESDNRFVSVWQSINHHAGEKFSTVTGLPFSYAVAGDAIWIERDGRIIDQALSRGEFHKAWDRGPVTGPSELQDLRGPSYIFAILSDSRIIKKSST